jgi:hypothetical protein
MKPAEIHHMARQILSDKPSTIESPSTDPIENGVHRMDVECLKNGYMVSTHRQTGRQTGHAVPEPQEPQMPERHFFPDHEKVAEHVRATLGASHHGQEAKTEPDLTKLKT